jgi:glycerol-3-phosphate dehydrogenase (NAD(P)+)
MKIAVLGAGAFGTALAIALARKGAEVGLWARDATQVADMRKTRQNARRLPGINLPKEVTVSADLADFGGAEIMLLAMPMQQLASFTSHHASALADRILVGCAKGIELATGRGATQIIAEACPDSDIAILTGPSFAADIAAGLPTALTLAYRDESKGAALQEALSTPSLRLYWTTDMVGAELGGALKNVIAIAAGIVIGAGLGDSARAALITRGFSEIGRLALLRGARSETLAGLAGLGDLILTCTSVQSRNFRFGRALGAGKEFDMTMTVEGSTTAKAVSNLAKNLGIDMPIATMVAELVDQKVSVNEAIAALLARPLKRE